MSPRRVLLFHDPEHTGKSYDRVLTKLDLRDYLPPIDIAIKVHRICNLDFQQNTFSATFSVMLDWEDPSVALLGVYDGITSA